ncbi:GSTO1 [Cordylochernes scorpioides]|uniref:GSTO1 n=1 Tax=Cordylochernes scorpioides TaxID=51811 RepID=A0ABY6JX61_9ARAC|nr:GSTO1 [Cordylochernes scorpioides]
MVNYRNCRIIDTVELRVDVVNIHLKDKPEWLVEKNPLGQVPVLEKDGELVRGSMNIIEYLEKHHPCPRLFPENWTQEQQLLEEYDKIIPSAIHKFFTEPDDVLPELWENAQNRMEPLETELAKRATPFFGGEDAPGVLDLMLWPWMELAQVAPKLLGADFNHLKFPKLGSWVRLMESQPFVYKTTVDYPTLLEYMRSYRCGNYQYDMGLSDHC